MRYVFQIGSGPRHQHHDFPDDAAALTKAQELSETNGLRVRVFREPAEHQAIFLATVKPAEDPPAQLH